MDEPIEAFVEIRRNADGLIRKRPNAMEYWGDFIWCDGNFACDCNRYIFWCEAGDEPEVEDQEAPEHECGQERFSVRLTDRSGKILYCDFPGEFSDGQSTREDSK